MSGYYRRSEYSMEERQNILKYIIDNKQYYGLKGRSLWMQMESERVCNRTWQSMKEHFRSKIIPELSCFKIPTEERQRILAGFRGTRLKEVTRKPIDVHYVFDHDKKDDGVERNILERRKNQTRPESRNQRLPDIIHEHLFSSSSEEDLTNENTSKTNQKGKRRRLSSSSSSSEKSFCLLDYKNYRPLRKTQQEAIKECQSKDLNGSDSDSTIILNTSILPIVNPEDVEFRIEDDLKIIAYFKENLSKLRRWKDLDTYALMKSSTGNMPFQPQLLRKRFMDHILPNLYKYSEVTYDEMIDMYDNTGTEIPLDLQAKIAELAGKRNTAEKQQNFSIRTYSRQRKSLKKSENSIEPILNSKSIEIAKKTPYAAEFLDCSSIDLSEPEHTDEIQIYVRETEPFSKGEDLRIVEVFKRYRNFLKISSQQVFRLMAYVFQRTEKSLKDRFINHIIHDLMNFVNLSTGDMVEFYLISENKSPKNLKFFLENRCDVKFLSDDTNKKSCAVQATKELCGIHCQDYISFRHKGNNFAFISEKAKDIEFLKLSLENDDFTRENMYVVQETEYEIWKSLKQIEFFCNNFIKSAIDSYLLQNKIIDEKVCDDILKYDHEVLEPVLKQINNNNTSSVLLSSSSSENCRNGTNEIVVSSSVSLPTCAPISFTEDMIRQDQLPPYFEQNLGTHGDVLGKGHNFVAVENATNSDNKFPDVTDMLNINNDDLNNRCVNDGKMDEIEEFKPNIQELDLANIKTEQYNYSEDEEMPEIPFQMQSVMLSRRASQMIKQERISVAHLMPQLPPEEEDVEEQKSILVFKDESEPTNSRNVMNFHTVVNDEAASSTNIQIVEANINGENVRRVFISQVRNSSQENSTADFTNLTEHNYSLQ